MSDKPFPDMSEINNRLVIEEDLIKAILGIIAQNENPRILISLSRSLAKSTTVEDDLREQLGHQLVGVETVLTEHSPYENIFELAQKINEQRATHILSIGGGSVIDGTKIALVVANLDIKTHAELSELTYATDKGLQIEDWPIQHIAIPTTLSGAEFTPLAGATSSISGRKEGFLNPHLVPDRVILCSRLSVYTPERLWLSSGIRSVDHAIETLCAPGVDEEISSFCAKGLELLFSGLNGTRSDPESLAHRANSQLGVYYATSGLSRYRMGASHGLGYLLGTIGNVPHGLTSCVLLPAVLSYNLSDTKAPQTQIAKIIGAARAEEVGTAMRQFIGGLGLPNELSSLELSEAALEEIQEAALTHPVVQANPKAIMSKENVAEILSLAG